MQHTFIRHQVLKSLSSCKYTANSQFYKSLALALCNNVFKRSFLSISRDKLNDGGVCQSTKDYTNTINKSCGNRNPLNSIINNKRFESSKTTQEQVMSVFDRKAKRLQRDRAALSYVDEDVSVYEYLKEEFGYRLADRVCDIKRQFKVGVDLGCGRGYLSKNIDNEMIETLFQCEMSTEMLRAAEQPEDVVTHRLIVDEEFLPFKENSLDIVVSNLSLHWVNDLPHCLRQVLQALKNDGVFIGNMFGGDTLYQLRAALQLAELEREGGFAPHISPFASVSDLGNLLTRAGFTMLTIDTDEATINYPSMIELMYDLKGMAENNCSWNRKSQLHRDTILAAASIYKEMYGGEEEGVPATFQVISFIGWKPDKSQPKAAKRGSGEISFKDLDKVDELIKEAEKKQQKYKKDDNDNEK